MAPINTVSTLKPGLLVSLKTSIVGGVSYQRVDLEQANVDAQGVLRERWETTKQVVDPKEHDYASKVRSEARQLVTRVCCPSAFGLLCPNDREDDLRDAMEAARYAVTEFNAGARTCRIEVYVLVGRVAQDDAEAARAIGSEMRGLIDAMLAGIQATDPKAIREAASKARQLGGMLSASAVLKVEEAIREARSIASALVKAGETAATVVAEVTTARLDGARFAFLDLDAAGTQVEPVAPAGRGIDLDPSNPAQVSAAPDLFTPRSLEL